MTPRRWAVTHSASSVSRARGTGNAKCPTAPAVIGSEIEAVAREPLPPCLFVADPLRGRSLVLGDGAKALALEELSDALGFELPAGLAEPTVSTSPLPFDAAEDAPPAEPEAGAIEDETTVH